jgi:trehalose 6-phosphate phosphatase
VAAEHGAVRRDAKGIVQRQVEATATADQAAQRLQAAADRHEGLLLERKTASVALHYRQRPELEAYCAAAIEGVLREIPGLSLIPGKMVFELKPPEVDKGRAVEAFLAEPPFQGRVPVVIGDDRTDEYAFAVANQRGGVSVKIGEGETAAKHRLATREAFLDWAESLVKTETQ